MSNNMEWISVEDRLPDQLSIGQYVYVLCVFKGVHGHFVKQTQWLFNRFYDGANRTNPTHWMPLPKLPKGKQ